MLPLDGETHDGTDPFEVKTCPFVPMPIRAFAVLDV
jgi:hypothetical protein